MEVILLKKVENLGNLGDKVNVKAGYGRNYLIPTAHAVPATPGNLEAFEARRTELEKAATEAVVAAEARKDGLDEMRISIVRKAGDEGRLFGSVGTADIATALTEAGQPVEKQEVRLPSGALRTTGEYDVTIHLHSGVDAVIKLEVVGES